MIARKSASLLVSVLSAAALIVVAGSEPTRAAQQTNAAVTSCDMAAVSSTKAEFQRLSALHRFDARAASMDDVRAASLAYVANAEACYNELYGPAIEHIDDGGLTLGVEGAAAYSLISTKWGSGSPFNSNGVDANGPRIAGGSVTYSYMANGIGGFEAEGGAPGTSVAFSSLPTYSACFVTEITNAFAAWSAIANVQFVQVADNDALFNAAGAAGDIRIAGHVFDGPSSVLAHAYYPPPNGTSAAGDMHFDVAENWSCTPGSGLIDIGIVAAHEIGHSIGLAHEVRTPGRTALMNPFYSPSLASIPLGDDINGAENIYGSAVGRSDDAIVDFGAAYGVWILNYGVSWTQLHAVSPEQTVTGDLDGNGIDDIISDFGSTYGVWIRMNNAGWFQLHTVSPTHMAVGDLDNSGRDDVVINFTGFGVWRWMNNTSFVQLHAVDSSIFAIGNIDNLTGDDVVITFPGYGVYRWMNNAAWVQVHVLDANQIVIGDLNETSSAADNADDFILNFAGYGIFLYPDLGAPVQLHSVVAARMSTGDLNRDGKDELVVDFGAAYGIWILNYGVGWTQLHAVNSQDLTLGDLDGNGQAEILVDFGPTYGFWIYVNNASWIQAHTVSPEGFAIGDLN